jgi:hypothetical protein
VHGLTNAIWQRPEPKPAVNKKRGVGAQQKRVGAKDEEQYREINLDPTGLLLLLLKVAVEPCSPTVINLPSHETMQAGVVNQGMPT